MVRINGITVEINGSTTGLSKSLESVNKTIKTTQSQLKDVERLLKLDPSNTELLVILTHRALLFHPFIVFPEFGSCLKSKHYSASRSSNSSREEL